ncbi:MAG: hypothetical protein DRP87_15310 [Spirochaetes bacterium]|nr:MAG: hypothetical protein DRP87_15310 [Spirochaetota bacterium]
MKFKTIFILFNIVIILAFLIVYFMPIAILGFEYARVFWSKNWFLPLVFFLIIGILNFYFIQNWRLFQLMEREDWDGIVEYLEDKIFRKKIVGNQPIRILINAYFVKSNLQGIENIEAHLREKKPEAIARFAIPLGIPYLLKNDPPEMEQYFGRLRERTRGNTRNWMSWNYAFSLMMAKKREKALEILVDLNNRVKEPVLKLLTLYLLDAFSSADKEIKNIVEDGKNRLKKRFNSDSWERELAKSKANIQVIILGKLIQEAAKWGLNFNGSSL